VNQNSIQEEIKNRLKSGNAWYHLVQNLLSSSLISKNLKIKIYRIITLPVVLYGCETWLLTVREKRRLRLFEKRVLRRKVGPKRDEVTWEWIELHNECLASWAVLLAHYCTGVKIEKNEMGGACSAVGGRESRVQGFGGESWGKETTGETGRRWENNTKMDLQE
jgi:hypothetical protein